MRHSIEYEIIQNPALGAAAIMQAVIKYHEVRDEGMPLPLLMAVLPMVFHRKTTDLISGMRLVGGGLRRAKGSDSTISVGLQRRMEGMAKITLRALNISVSCKDSLELRCNGTLEVVPCRRTVSASDMGYKDGDALEIMKAAKRVGHWFGTYEMTDICRQLNLRF